MSKRSNPLRHWRRGLSDKKRRANFISYLEWLKSNRGLHRVNCFSFGMAPVLLWCQPSSQLCFFSFQSWACLVILSVILMSSWATEVLETLPFVSFRVRVTIERSKGLTRPNHEFQLDLRLFKPPLIICRPSYRIRMQFALDSTRWYTTSGLGQCSSL